MFMKTLLFGSALLSTRSCGILLNTVDLGAKFTEYRVLYTAVRERPVYTAVLHDIPTSNIDLHTPPASGPMEHILVRLGGSKVLPSLLTPLCMCMELCSGASIRRSITIQ